jgi:uncharacterized protein (DUF2336 family)
MSLLSDVQTLQKTPLPEIRESIAQKVTQYFNAGIFDEKEIAVANDIIRLLAKDVEIRIRRTLSENLKANPKLPHDVALVLAHDDADVSLPLLEFSKVLTDGDLIEIIRSARQVSKLLAITRRAEVTEPISSALIHTRNEKVVMSLFANKSAKISEESLNIVVADFKSNGNVVDTLINRGNLPLGIVEKLIASASEKTRVRLVNEYNLNEKTADALMNATREKATIDLLNPPQKIKPLIYIDADEIGVIKKTDDLVKHLYKEGRLTQSIILRSLCEGNMHFFESSMALLAGIPIVNARTLIRSGDVDAIEAVCRKANLPSSILKPVQIIIAFSVSGEAANIRSTNVFKKLLIEHIISNEYDKDVPLMPYVMALVNSKIETADVVS